MQWTCTTSTNFHGWGRWAIDAPLPLARIEYDGAYTWHAANSTMLINDAVLGGTSSFYCNSSAHPPSFITKKEDIHVSLREKEHVLLPRADYISTYIHLLYVHTVQASTNASTRIRASRPLHKDNTNT